MKSRLRARAGSGKRWYRIENNDLPGTEEPAEIFVYDEISYWGITASDFVRDLQGIDRDRIVLHLNTPGGDVFDGIAIYNALRQHKAHVTTYVDGLAASIGSVIAMAGDEVVMGNYAQMMIHNAMGAVYGNASDMRELADLLDKTSANLAQVYADRSGTDVADWLALMDAETWFTADEAVEFGLADRVMEYDRRKIDNKWDLSQFKFKNRDEAPAPRSRSAGTRPATPPAPIDNVLVPVRRTAGDPVAPPEGVADAGEGFVFDPDAFTTAMRYAADPPVETVEAPFNFDPEIFRAMMNDRSKNAPAIAQTPKAEQPPSFESTFDPEFLRARIREGTSRA